MSIPNADPSKGRAVPPPGSPPAATGDPDHPRDLVGAPIVVTGTVEVTAHCVTLTAKGRRWALVGSATAGLTDGRTVTVRGRPATVPPGCDADFGIAVRQIS
jgi:hypothetical protein